jgi:hypothetical protein
MIRIAMSIARPASAAGLFCALLLCCGAAVAQETKDKPKAQPTADPNTESEKAEPEKDFTSEIFANRSPETRPFYTREFEVIPPTDTLPPLTIEGQLQFRYMYTKQNRDNVEDASGFGFRRARLGVEGKVTDSIEYSIEGAFGRDDGFFTLNDATINFKLPRDFGFRIGRFRPNFYREEDVSSKRQILVDRTLLQGAFGLPRTVGVALDWEGEWLRAAAGVADQTEDFGFDESFVYTLRSDVLLDGKWKYFRSFSAEPDQKLGIMAGAGLLYLDNSLSEGGVSSEIAGEVFRWTVDVSAVYQGLSGFAAVVGSQGGETENEDGVNQYGFLVQGAWRMDETWEVAARYEYGDADQLAKDLSLITLGVNYYIADHALKWQNDIGFALNEVNGFWSSSSRGWLTDRAGNDGQIVFRSQIQLLF